MSQHAGIGIGGVSASEGVEIAATHTDSTYSEKSLTTGSLGGRELALNQLTGCI
jgi:hypothetical protein